MIQLNAYNISYGRRKGQESKCQFDSQPLKVENCLDLHAYKKRATYHWKALDKGYKFFLDLASIKGLHKKLRASKVARVPNSKIIRFPTWESWEKCHLGVAPMANCRNPTLG